MKHLNFLSKRQSCSHNVVTLALTVGSPLAHRRGAMLKLLSVLVFIFTFGVGQMWGDTKTEGFEGATTDNNYTTVHSITTSQSDCGIAWTMLGTPSTSSKITSNNSVALRLYSSTSSYPYLQTTTAISGLSQVSFKAKAQTSNSSQFKIDVMYSNNNGTSWSYMKMSSSNGSDYKLQTPGTSASTYTAYVPSGITGSFLFKIAVNSSSSKPTSSNSQCTIDDVVFTYTPTVSYTITAQSSNNTYGTVSLDGSVITATPAENCRIASTAYNVTNGTATVVRGSGDDINKFTVTPTSNCTVRINFEPIPKHTLNYHDGSGDGSKTNVYEGTNLITALGTPAASCDKTSTTFVGWTTTEITTKTDTKPTLVSADAVVNSTTAAAKYYAVYAKSNTGSWSITSIDKLNNSSGYAGYNGSHTASGISYTSSQVMAQSSTIQFQSNSGYMYNTTVMSADITSIVITSSSANWSVYTSNSSISSTPASGAISISSSGNTRTFTVSATGHKYFHIKGGSNTPQATNITVNYGTTKDYITTCCTELASINGSVSWSNGEATEVHCDNAAGMSSWALAYKLHSATDVPANWTTYSGSWGTYTQTNTNDRRKTTTAITGLTAGSSYDFKISATSDGSTYCSGAFSETVTATAPKITATADLGDFGYAQGSNPEEQSFTVSGTALTGSLTVKAPANYLIKVGTGEWSSAGGNKSIIVSTSPSNLSSTTIYVKAATDLNEGDNPSGNIEITGGGAAKVEVAVSATITSACAVNPTIGAATLKAGGAFGLDGVAVSVTGMTPGTNCTWTDYGFYWGTSDNKKAHKVEIGNSGNATSFEATLAFETPAQFVAGTTYYFCAYGKNAKSGAEIICGTEASFTPYTVSYNANGGSGEVATVVVNAGGSVTLPSATAFTLNCNDMTKWALNSTSGTQYNPEGAYSNINANAEFYAIWNTRTYTVQYAAGTTPANGGAITGSHANDTKTCGVNLTLPGVTFSSTGYTQDGWAKADGGNKTNNLSGSYSSNQAQIFYPHWLINTYNVTKGTKTGCSGNDFTVAATVDHYGSITVTASPDAAHKGSPTVTISPSGNGSVSGTTISNIIGDIEVSVSFAAKESATIILHDAGGQSTVSGTHYEMDNYTLPNTATDCTESEFYGWYTEPYVDQATAPTGSKYIAKSGSKALVAGENHFYAVYATIDDRYTNTFTKITSVGDLTTGDYLIAGISAYCMSNTVNASNYMNESNMSSNLSEGVITNNSNNNIIWTITKDGDNYTFYNAAATGNKYLALTTTSPAMQAEPHNFTVALNGDCWVFSSVATTGYVLGYYTYFKSLTAKSSDVLLYKRDKAPSAGAPYTTSPSCTTHDLTSVVDPSSPAGGTVELGKTTVLETKTTTATATPSDHYTFSHWTISGAGASLENADGEGKSTDNPVEVTMGTANATITAHFTEKPKCTVEFYNNGGSAISSNTYWLGETPTAPTLNDGTTGEGNACDATSDKHYGWTQTAWQQTITKDDVDAKTAANVKVYTKGSTLPAIEAGDNGKTIKYYAVWAHATNSSVQKNYTLSISYSDCPTSYDSPLPTKNAEEVNGTGTVSVSFGGTGVMNQSSSIQFRRSGKGAGYIYNTVDLGNITDITTNNSSIVYNIGTSENPTSGTSGGYFKIYNNSDNTLNPSGITVNFTKSVDGVAYSAFLTNCCTPLPTIVGAISVGNINEGGGTASWSWSGEVTTGISKNILNVYNTSNVLVKTIDNISGSATSQSITGLDPCTSYYVTLTTVAEDGYCAGVEQGQSANFTTNGWAVHYTGGDATEGALLSNVTKQSGDNQACLSEDYVATFTANEGFELPETIVVYIAGVEVTAGVDYTWVISNGTGTLTIETDGLSEEIDVRIIGDALDCQNDPAVGAASLSGTFNLGEVGVTVSDCGTGSTYCGWIDYGFVWGMSANPTVSDHKVQVSTSGNVTTWNGSLTGSFETGKTYYFRAYGKNSKDGAAFVYSASDATFTPQSVTFNKNNGEDNDVVYVNSGSAVAQPSNPSRTGYEFVKWQKEGSDYVFSSAVNGNITLDAVWTPNQYTLAWNSNGGSTLDGSYTSGSTDCGATLTPPTNPTREGYNFTGWNSAENGTGDAYTGTMPAGNVTYYAQWSIITCSVTWSVNGNNTYADDDPAEPTTSVTYNSKVAKLPTAPTSNDCDNAKVFVGWRATAIEGTSEEKPGNILAKLADFSNITGDITYYAVFADVTGGASVTLDFPDDNSDYNGLQNYTSTWTAIKGDYSWSIENFNNNNWGDDWTFIKCGRKNNASTGKITTSNAIGFTVDSVLVNIGSITAGNVNSAKLYISSASNFATKTSMDIEQSTGLKKLVMASPAKDMYYQIEYDCSASSNGVVQISSVTYKQKLDTTNYVTTCPSCTAEPTFNATPAVSAIGCEGATVTATNGLETLGEGDGCNIREYGFVWSTTETPTVASNTGKHSINENIAEGTAWSHSITDLNPGTQYYVRAYAENKSGVAYSAAQSFWTNGVNSIAITTAPTKTNYIVGETFDATGMVVTATMASGTDETVTGDVTYSNSAFSVAGTNLDFAINYSLCETNVQTTQPINIFTLSVTEGTNPSYGTATNSSANIVSVTGLGSHKTYDITVTSNNAELVDNNNGTYSVINPTGNVTVRVDYKDANQVKVYYKVNGVAVTGLTKDVYESETTTLPTATQLSTEMTAQSMSVPDATLPNFYGWSESEFGEQTTEPTIVTGTPTINAEKTYYAVFTNVNTKQILPSNFINSYADNNGEKTIDGVTYQVSNICNQSGIQFRSTPGYLYSKTALPYIVKIEITTDDALVVNACSNNSGSVDGSAISAEGTSPRVYTFPEGKQYFKVTGAGGTDHASLIKIYYASEAVRYSTDFRTLTFKKLDNTSAATVMAKNHVYTIVDADVPSADGYIFQGWTGTDRQTYNVGDEATLSDNLTLKPNVEITGNVTLPDGLGDVTVKDGKTITVSESREINDFIIEATEGHSGQVKNAENLTVNGNAYYDLTLNPSGTMNHDLWYAFAVPFPVDAATGIQRLSNDGKTANAGFNSHYVLLKYDSEERAANGKGNSWKYITKGETLMPGNFYMIALNSNVYNRVRMTKKAGATLNNKADLNLRTYSSASDLNANWNALANNALAYANVDADGGNDALKVITYDSENNSYDEFGYGDITLTVGTPFFVQTVEQGTMSVTIAATNNTTVKAPAHEVMATEEFQLRLGADTESYYDKLFVSANEDAKSEYQIGHDLAKMGVSSTIPQMYVPAYDTKLCDAEFPLVNNQASFPLTFVAPQAGTYQLYVAREARDAELYLTYEGGVIWNLSMSAYELELTKGTTEGYGLLLQAKAPGAATGVDNIDASEAAQKVIINDHVYILRNGQMYGVDGKAVK